MPKAPEEHNVQPTQPKKGEPVEIPVPTREDVMRDLAKLAKPQAEPSDEPRPYRRSAGGRST